MTRTDSGRVTESLQTLDLTLTTTTYTALGTSANPAADRSGRKVRKQTHPVEGIRDDTRVE